MMDAVNFIKEKERMCNTCGSCLLRPAWLDDGCSDFNKNCAECRSEFWSQEVE